MESVRIEPTKSGTLLIDVVCDCGRNGLVNEATGEPSFKHPIAPGSGTDTVLACDCGKKYRLHPQTDHVHVFTEG